MQGLIYGFKGRMILYVLSIGSVFISLYQFQGVLLACGFSHSIQRLKSPAFLLHYAVKFIREGVFDQFPAYNMKSKKTYEVQRDSTILS